MASPTSSRSSSLVNTSPLDARVWATIPTAFRLSMAHPCRRVNAHTTTARRAAPEGANLGILNDQLYTGSALDRCSGGRARVLAERQMPAHPPDEQET